MFCTKCGFPVREDVGLCPKCGASVVRPDMPPASKPAIDISLPKRPVPLQTNEYAIASLVCGILGILFIPAILAIIFGIVANKQINNVLPEKGKGLAITGLVLGVLFGIFWVGAIIVTILVFQYDLI